MLFTQGAGFFEGVVMGTKRGIHLIDKKRDAHPGDHHADEHSFEVSGHIGAARLGKITDQSMFGGEEGGKTQGTKGHRCPGRPARQ